MAGITDGRLLEDRSTPLGKLEVDVATLAQLNTESSTRAAADNTLQGNIDSVNSTLTDAIDTHKSTGISAAHPGTLDVEDQIPNGSIGVWKLSFTPTTQADFSNHINNAAIHFTLGTSGTQAAPGNHTHDFSNINAHKLDNYHAQDLIDMINAIPGGPGGNIVITGGGVLAAGSGSFAGAGNVTAPIAINPAPGTTNYAVTITPTDAAANLGEVYVNRSTASFTVENTGAYTGGFYWTVNVAGSSLPLGPGSNLDADKLDGLHGSSYALVTHDHNGVYSVVSHTHTQVQSHDSPDTDSSTGALHHTIGTGAFQAAAGNHVHASENITFTAAGNLSAGSVRSALIELDTEKAPLTHTHTAGEVSGTVALAADSQKLGGALPAAYALVGHNHDIVYAASVHTHTQAQSHGSVDTDSSVASLHHTLGTGANQAAAGNHAHAASAISFTATGGVSAVTVQSAIAELDSDKAAAMHTHTGADITSAVAQAGNADKLDNMDAADFALAGHDHDADYAPISHNHTQAQSHDSADTDSATSALHHTIGAGANQAAAGNHSHNIIPAAGQRGVSTFAGTGLYTEITFTPDAGSASYFVGIMPIGSNPTAVGAFSVEIIDSDTFRVYNTGDNTMQFAWVVLK